MVEQDDADLSSVVLIDDSSSNVDRVFPGEAWSWGDSAVSIGWDHPAETCLDHGLSSSWDDCLLRGADIITSGKGGSLFGDYGIFIELFDKEFTDLLADFFCLVFHDFPPN